MGHSTQHVALEHKARSKNKLIAEAPQHKHQAYLMTACPLPHPSHGTMATHHQPSVRHSIPSQPLLLRRCPAHHRQPAIEQTMGVENSCAPFTHPTHATIATHHQSGNAPLLNPSYSAAAQRQLNARQQQAVEGHRALRHSKREGVPVCL